MSVVAPTSGLIFAPRPVAVNSGHFVFESKDNPRAIIKRKAPGDLLKRFCSIVDSGDSDRAAFRFAHAWGAAALCDHGLPIGHAMSNKGEKCKSSESRAIEHCKAFAVYLQALRNIGKALNRGEKGDAVDWRLAEESFSAGWPPKPKWMVDAEASAPAKTLAYLRTRLQGMIGNLTIDARLVPRFSWDMRSARWSIELDSPRGEFNLAAILVLHLILEIAAAKKQRRCAACPLWFPPTGRQIYCPSCGRRAAMRAAWRRQQDGTAKRRSPTVADSVAARVRKRGKTRSFRRKRM